MNLKLLFISCLLALASVSNLYAEEWSVVEANKKGTITVFYYNSDHFINDASGKLEGIEYDILIAFKNYLKNQGIDLTINFKRASDFSSLYERIKNGEDGDFGACSFSITEKRKKEVSFSPKYMTDIQVLISSSNVPLAKNEEDFIQIFTGLTAYAVLNTTFEEDLIKLRETVPGFDIKYEESSKSVREKVLENNDMFAYIELPTYLKLFNNGLRFKRQNLFKVERDGYALTLPKGSTWEKPITDFFNSTGFKAEVNEIIKKHLGSDVKDLLWNIEEENVSEDSEEISLLTMERETQEMEIKQQDLKLKILIGGVFVVLIVVFLLFYSYRMKRAVNKSLTERNRLIEDQKSELERMSLVANKTNNGVLILDAENKIEWLNEAYTNMTGYSMEDLKGEAPGDILIGDKTDRATLKVIREKIANTKPWREQILVCKKSGEEMWMRINSTPVFNDDNEFTRYIEIIEDVTDKVESEAELSRLSIVAEKMNEAVVITDASGKIEYYNEGLIRNSGYSADEFKVQFKDSMYLQKIASRDDIQDIIDGFKTNPTPFLYDSQHVKKDGSSMWTAASLSPVYDAKNNLSKIIIVYTDIDESKEFSNQLKQKNEEIVDSIYYAKLIQDAMLPPESILENVFEDHFILFKPKDIVSGDFYWFDEVGKYCVLALADCTGHGVPGAFMSMMGSNFLTNILTDNAIRSTKEALTLLDAKVKKALRSENHQSRDGMDIVVMAYDKDEKVLDFSGGNNSLFILRDGELIQHKGDRFSIGSDGIKNKVFTEKNIQLEKGDTVYTFTDGYKDQFGGPKGKKFMQKQLLSIILENANAPLKKQKDVLTGRIEEWMEGYEQVDDITVMAFKVES